MLSNNLRAVDEIFRTTPESITNAKIEEFPWDQPSLPIAFGGLGIRKVEDLTIPA